MCRPPIAAGNTTAGVDDCIMFDDVQEGFIKGPAFTIVYTMFGLPLSYLADHYTRRWVLIFGLLFWSGTTACLALVHEYYQLAILRLLLGIGEAACNPVAFSIIADIFAKSRRATALSVYHTGVYVGGGLGYVVLPPSFVSAAPASLFHTRAARVSGLHDCATHAL